MCVAIERNAVRRGGNDPIERPLETARALPRQTIDEIRIDRAKAGFPRSFHHRQRLRLALYAVDGGLNVRVEVLYSDAHAVETKRRELLHATSIDGARIDFDCNLGLLQ